MEKHEIKYSSVDVQKNVKKSKPFTDEKKRMLIELGDEFEDFNRQCILYEFQSELSARKFVLTG